MNCRPNCGACCIIPSISSPIPGMPKGKPAGVRCVQLNDDYSCKIFNAPNRPRVCGGFLPELDICGENRDQAIQTLRSLEGI